MRTLAVASVVVVAAAAVLGYHSAGRGSDGGPPRGRDRHVVRFVAGSEEAPLPGLSALDPTPFEIRGRLPGVQQGDSLRVRFRARTGLPFQGGTSDTETVPAAAVSCQVVQGVAPTALLPGATTLEADVTVLRRRGNGRIHTCGLVALFLAPDLCAAEVLPGTVHAASDPTPIVISGLAYGTGASPIEVAVLWTCEGCRFADGGTTTRTQGILGAGGRIDASTPDTVLEGLEEGVLYLAGLEFPDGTTSGASCEPLAIPVRAPRLRTDSLGHTAALAPEPREIVFSDIGPLAAPLPFRATWQDDGAGVLAEPVETESAIGPDGRAVVTAPAVAPCGKSEVRLRLAAVRFADGTTTPARDAASLPLSAPRLGSGLPPTLPALGAEDLVIEVEHAGPSGVPVEVEWTADFPAFGTMRGALEETTTTAGVVETDGTLRISPPRATLVGVASVPVTLDRVVWPSGACTPADDAKRTSLEGEGVPDVMWAFNRLSRNGEPLGWRFGDVGAGLAPSLTTEVGLAGDKSHFQGIVRLPDRPGRPPTMVLSASMNELASLDDRGALLTVALPSREGRPDHRLASNLLLKDRHLVDTVPMWGDRVVHVLRFPHKHLGGMQLAGDILVVAAEDPATRTTGEPAGRIYFVDYAGGSTPEVTPYTIDFPHKMGACGITRLVDGRYLLVSGGYAPPDGLGGSRLHFFVSDAIDLPEALRAWRPGDAPIFRPLDTWESYEVLDSWPPASDPYALGEVISEDSADDEPAPSPHRLWPIQNSDVDSDSTWQTLNLLRQRDGQVFLLGAMNTLNYSPVAVGKDVAVLYRIRSTNSWTLGGEPVPAFADGDRVSVIVESGIHQHGSFEHPLSSQSRIYSNFNAASGVFVAPNGELILYGGSHNARGPQDSDGRPTGQFVEYRSIDLRTFPLPPAAAPQDRAWVELWNGTSGWDRSRDREPSLLVEFVDHGADDYLDLKQLTRGWPNPERYGDQADSVRWYAPVGMLIVLWEDDRIGSGSGDLIVLEGTGRVESIPDLGAVNFRDTNDSAHDEVSAVSFHRAP